MDDVAADLSSVVSLIKKHNPTAKILLTVSPVGLVATAEQRNVVISSSLSKARLRVAADEIVNSHDDVDYFPSYEIITSPLSRGRYWKPDLREVTQEGVDTVMRIFFKSRFGLEQTLTKEDKPSNTVSQKSLADIVDGALQSECDEMYLDRKFIAGM